MGYLRRKTLEWLPGIALSAILVSLAVRSGAFQTDAWVFEGLCREIVAGTTEGRQALVGSGWHPPLPLLVGAPAAFFAPHAALPWAAVFTVFLAFAIALYAVWITLGRAFHPETAAADGPPPARLVRFSVPLARSSAWIACAGLLWHLAGPADPVRMVVVATGVVSLCKLADWWGSGRLSDLVKLAFAIAALVLCGFATAGLAFALFLLMPLPVLWHPALRGRFQGVFVLGVLPGLYTLLVWCLMGWLILGDGFYALRGMGRCLSWNPSAPGLPAAVAAVLLLVAAIARRRDASLLALLAGIAVLALWAEVFRSAGLDHTLDPSPALGVVAAVLALARIAARSSLRDGGAAPLRRTTLGGVVMLVFSTVMLATARLAFLARCSPEIPPIDRSRVESAVLLEHVRTTVEAQTPYGRIFVCGYTAPGLLGGERPEPFTPCLDPFLGALRTDYTRQHIFLLMPRPRHAAAWESLYWRYPGIFERGAQRLLFARDFGDWRLYELVSAPGEDQLQEWRKGE
jgi:hypothetical protein